MLTADAGKALAGALAANSSLKELNVSSNNWMEYGDFGDLMGDGPGFAKELAIGVSANGALGILNISDNNLTRGALKPGKSGGLASDYETDMTGIKQRPCFQI